MSATDTDPPSPSLSALLTRYRRANETYTRASLNRVIQDCYKDNPNASTREILDAIRERLIQEGPGEDLEDFDTISSPSEIPIPDGTHPPATDEAVRAWWTELHTRLEATPGAECQGMAEPSEYFELLKLSDGVDGAGFGFQRSWKVLFKDAGFPEWRLRSAVSAKVLEDVRRRATGLVIRAAWLCGGCEEHMEYHYMVWGRKKGSEAEWAWMVVVDRTEFGVKVFNGVAEALEFFAQEVEEDIQRCS